MSHNTGQGRGRGPGQTHNGRLTPDRHAETNSPVVAATPVKIDGCQASVAGDDKNTD